MLKKLITIIIFVNKFLKFKKLGFKFLTLIHPSATVSSESQINEGSQILSNSSVILFHPNIQVQTLR